MALRALQAVRSVRALRRRRRGGAGDEERGSRSPHVLRRRRWGALGIVALSLVLLTAGTCKEAPHGISDVSETFEPRGVAWNGVKVYLSSPRHASSGDRGECGWEENVNGRIFNLYAADLNDSETLGTLTTRGYQARVSPNTRDDGWRLNREESNNWGADVHIVTHSNAYVGCDNAAQYLLVMYKSGDANSIGLTNDLLAQLDPQVPGHQNSWDCDGLGECGSNAAHIAYLELFFHTNQAATDWFIGPLDDPEATGAMDASPYLGLALDEHLGYPRASSGATLATTSLDGYAGFGESPEAMQRDETIAYWEAFQREQLIRECMVAAGFSYMPAVAFPAGDMLEVAAGLGIEERSPVALVPLASPVARNRDYEAGLSDGDRERYNQALLGESAADVAEADRTGEVPAGRTADDFATAGCYGEARDAVPGIWEAPQALAAEVDALRRSDAPAAAVDEFVARHADRLDAVASGYEGVMERIAGDEAFATYLAAQVGAAT